MNGAGNAIDLRLSTGARGELAGPFSTGRCCVCQEPDGCLVCVTVQPAPDVEPVMLMFCAPCVIGALGIRLAAAESARGDDGVIDLGWLAGVGVPSVRGVRHVSRPVGRPRSTEHDQETP